MAGKTVTTWDEALSMLRVATKEVSPENIALLLSGRASNEEAYLCAKLASALGIKNISAAGDPSDLDAHLGYRMEASGASLGTVEEIEQADTLLIVGDILTRSRFFPTG